MGIRFLIFFGLLVFLDIYIFNALNSAFKEFGKRTRFLATLFYWIGLTLLIVLIVNSLTGDLLPDGLSLYISAMVFIIYITKIIMALPFLVEDLYRAALVLYNTVNKRNSDYDASRSKFIRNTAIGIAAIPFVSLFYGLLGNQYRFRVLKESIPIKGLKKDLQGLKIVQISDIHAGTFVFKNPLNNIVKLIEDCDPDIVVFTGDLVNSQSNEIERFVDIFSQVKARYGVYSILGNHDYGDYVEWSSQEAKEENMEQLYALKRTMGWDLLRNENRKIKVGESEIALIGVENFSTLKRFPKKGDLAKAYAGTADADLKILLTHDPTHWDYEVNSRYKDIALTLAGHTHGFQYGIEIPGYFRWSPSQYAYKQWAGLYKAGQQYLYVNRGLGCLGYPGRVGILPEITEITLNSV